MAHTRLEAHRGRLHGVPRGRTYGEAPAPVLVRATAGATHHGHPAREVVGVRWGAGAEANEERGERAGADNVGKLGLEPLGDGRREVFIGHDRSGERESGLRGWWGDKDELQY